MITGNSWLLFKRAYSRWEGSSLSLGGCFSASIVLVENKVGPIGSQLSWSEGSPASFKSSELLSSSSYKLVLFCWKFRMGSNKNESRVFEGRISLTRSETTLSIRSTERHSSSFGVENFIKFSMSNVIVSFPTSKDIFLLNTSIIACAVAKNGLPRIIGIL
ncbi:hypothetical protein Tco_0738695 [Tanacetum coccineum]